MNSFLEVLVDKLRNSGVLGVVWGQDGNPFFKQVPEPPPAFPYVVIDIPETELVHYMEDVPYRETYRPSFSVVAEEPTIFSLSSPYTIGSVFHFLDGFRGKSFELSGTTFKCFQFLRSGYELTFDETARAPSGGRVWIARATYVAFVEPKV